jgi:small subunit ribosomal protein S16
MVKIRLQRVGKKKAPFYHIVVADSKSPRDGKIIEQIGVYNPMVKPVVIEVDKEKVQKWIKNGAKPSDTVKYLIDKAENTVITEKPAKAEKKEVVEEVEKAVKTEKAEKVVKSEENEDNAEKTPKAKEEKAEKKATKSKKEDSE